MYCCDCPINYKSVKIGTGTELQISVDQTTVPNNLGKATLCIVQTIPTVATPIPVQITINGTNYNLMTKCGNYVMSDQIRSRRRYYLVYGDNPTHFTVLNSECLCPTSYVTPPTTLSTASKSK